MTIDAAIDRLSETFAELGFEVPAAAVDAGAWEALDRELAPLALPADLRRLLQRVDVIQLPLLAYPRPAGVESGLMFWRQFRDDQAFPFPAGLFPWCYESHNHLFVELDGPEIQGGAMFEWAFGGSDFELRFHGAEDWIETIIAVLEERAFESFERDGRTWLQPDVDRCWELAAARRGVHAVYGSEHAFGEAEHEWPAHWAAAARLARVDPPPVFPPMTIAELLARRREGTVHALITGRPSYLSGNALKGSRIWLRDETGALDVACPADTRGLAAIGTNVRGPYRVELIAPKLSEPRRAIDWHALSPAAHRGLPDPRPLLAAQPPDATATVIHPPTPGI